MKYITDSHPFCDSKTNYLHENLHLQHPLYLHNFLKDLVIQILLAFYHLALFPEHILLADLLYDPLF